MRKVLIGLCLFGSACHVPSRVAMEGSGGRTAYNTAIQMTNSQQMLLNLVRLRYVDVPLFLDVSGVTTQFTYKTRVSPTVPIPGFDSENPFILGGELSWQDQPTISYAPLEGKSFTSRLLSPIQLSTLQQLVYSGWEIDRIFLMMLQNLDDLYNAPETSGPVPDRVSSFRRFSEGVEILRWFQSRGELQIGVVVSKENGEEQTLQIVVPDEGSKAKRLMELIPQARRERGWIHLTMEIGFNERGQLGVMPRTILSCMYYLSQGVSAPECHYECGLVKQNEGEEPKVLHEVLSSLFRVQCSQFAPRDAFVTVQYRKYWYYIDDCDLSSKKTFALLLQLYNLHAEETKSVGPILTLPLR